MQPVLTGIVNDFIMRCHTTLWLGPASQHPGGYCMCVRKQDKKIVGGYTEKVSQTFSNERKASSCDKRLVLTDQQLVEVACARVRKPSQMPCLCRLQTVHVRSYLQQLH